MSCSGGVCTPTAKKAALNVNDLANMLASGNATIKTNNVAQDIEIDERLSWTSINRLTLDSFQSIAFNNPVEIMGTGALTITTNDGGSGGDFRFFKKGHVKFWDLHSDLTINGNRYALAKSIAQIKKLIHRGRGEQYLALAEKIDATKYNGGVLPFEPTVLEGLGNTISNLTISSGADRSHVGMFLDMNGEVRDLGFLNVNITGFGSDQAVGAIAGEVEGAVLYSFVSGKVTATGSESGTGGLAGSLTGTIVGSNSSAIVIATAAGSVAGGLVGGNNAGNQGEWNGTVQDSYSTGTVTGSDGVAVGGLIGYNNGGAVKNSYAIGDVVGGSNSLVGGLAAVNANSDSSSPTILDSYSIGAVSGGSGAMLGGLIGEDLAQTGTINSYWDLDTSGISDPTQGAGNIQNDPGITGLNDAQLKSGLPAGFDKSVWKEKPGLNSGYPYLIDNPPAKKD